MFGGKVLELEWQKYLEQGRELGLEQGRELGLEQGLQQGRKEERADILSVLGISEDDYLKLKAKKEAEKGLVLHEEGLDYPSES